MQALKDPAAAVEQLKAHGVDLDGRTVVLFAPTWRGNTFAEPQVNAAELVRTVRQLQKRLGDEFLVLLKTHQLVHDAVRRRLGETAFLVPNDVPANVVLGVTDLLVTDYSSIFFDFLSTGRPGARAGPGRLRGPPRALPAAGRAVRALHPQRPRAR